MIGITSYGAYVPRTRIALSAPSGRPSAEGAPERAVAWNDEDAVTMGVTAAANCLRGVDRDTVDAVFFASTTYAFREKQAAALVARCLDLRRDIQTADHGGSLRAGTNALRAAADSVAAGSAGRVLVIASDCRMAAPGSPLEANLGDGAAAFLIGGEDAVASFEGSHAVSDEIVDVWRNEGDAFVHSWEDRFVVQEGYTPRIVDAVRGLCEKQSAELSEITRIALYAPDKRSHATAARALKLTGEQIQDPLFGRLGNAGTAFAPMQLAAALEKARPGEKILVASYGDGADALLLQVNENVEGLGPRRGVSWHLERRRDVGNYSKYLKARGLDPTEWDAGSDPGLSATIHFRERSEDLSLTGQKCRSCEAVQFPNQRVCETCFAKDDFEPQRLSDATGKVLTYTFDFFFPTPDPPTIVTICDIEGARVHIQLVNCKPEETRIGLPVEFELRRIHMVGGRPNYYWKATPLPQNEGDAAS